MDDPGQVAERIFERLADDERLRGPLTDTGFEPLLAWAAERALAIAPAFVQVDGTVPPNDVEWLAIALRGLVQGGVEAAATGDADELRRAIAELGPGIVDRAALEAALGRLALGDDPDANAQALAAALTAAPAASTGCNDMTGGVSDWLDDVGSGQGASPNGRPAPDGEAPPGSSGDDESP